MYNGYWADTQRTRVKRVKSWGFPATQDIEFIARMLGRRNTVSGPLRSSHWLKNPSMPSPLIKAMRICDEGEVCLGSRNDKFLLQKWKQWVCRMKGKSFVQTNNGSLRRPDSMLSSSSQSSTEIINLAILRNNQESLQYCKTCSAKTLIVGHYSESPRVASLWWA